MKVKKTELLDYNIRRSQFGLDFETYQDLQAGSIVEIEDEIAKIMIEKNYVIQGE